MSSQVMTPEEAGRACVVCSYSKTPGYGTCIKRRQKFIEDADPDKVVDCFCPRGSVWIMEER